MILNQVEIRFYEELNDFLPIEKKKSSFPYTFRGNPSVKDAIESLGVPHTEVDLILVNSKSVQFSYHIKNGDFISVYPVFESMDVANISRLREKPLREPKFILDVHLGKLARYLRMFGFDVIYRNNYDDLEIIKIAKREKSIILTRDIEMLKRKAVTHGYWIRACFPKEQLQEVILRFDLYSNIKPFHRCIVCNGIIKEIPKELIMDRLLPKTKKYYNNFFQCEYCKKIYWKGSHYLKMKEFIERVIKEA